MHALETGAQLRNGTRPRDPGRLRLGGELSSLDAECPIRLDLGKMPRHLAQRSRLGIGAEVVTILWKRVEQFDRLGRFAFPKLVEKFPARCSWSRSSESLVHRNRGDTDARLRGRETIFAVAQCTLRIEHRQEIIETGAIA